MQSSKVRAWAFRVLVNLFGVAAALLTIFLLQAVSGVQLPRYQVILVAFVVGLVINHYSNRKQIAKDSDPFSPETRARMTASQIAGSHSKK